MAVQYPSTILAQFDTNLAIITTETPDAGFKVSGYRFTLDKEPDSAVDGTYYLDVQQVDPHARNWGTGENISEAIIVVRVGYFRGGGDANEGDRQSVLRSAADDGMRLADACENPLNYNPSTTGIREIRYQGSRRAADLPRSEIWEHRFWVQWRSDLAIITGGASDVSASLVFDNNAAMAAYDFSNTNDGIIMRVLTYRDFFFLDKLTARTPVADSVIAAIGGGYLVRMNVADPYWATITDWYIDPAGTNPTIDGAAGDDEASGLVDTAPIKSIAEWRRRISGAKWTGNDRIKIHALSSSTVMDDGNFYGFTTEQIANTAVVVVGVPTVIGTGTITSYVPYAGNVRGKITDTAIPTSWTASDFVSTPTASRYIRKTGAGSVHYAPLLKDLGSNTIQMGIVSDWDPTNVISVQFAESNFAVGDAYEVVSMTRWPMLQCHLGNVRYQCLDVFDTPSRIQGFPLMQNNFVLCGFVGIVRYIFGGNVLLYNCAILGSFIVFQGVIGPVNCSFLNTLIQPLTGGSHWKDLTNVLIGCQLYAEKGSTWGGTGTLRTYDASLPCIKISTGSRAYIQAIVGEGNTGQLVTVDRGSQAYGAAGVTATTTDASPYSVSGVAGPAPSVNATTGDAIYT